MAFNLLDVTTPKGTDMVKFVDDDIRALKGDLNNNFSEFCGYPNNSFIKLFTWTTATRPTTGLVANLTGYNSDLQCIEKYDLTNTVWVPLTQQSLTAWTTTTRPSSPFTGQFGYCSDLDVFERYNGSAFVRVNSGRRGDIKIWSGSASDIQTGWALANGQSITIDGSTFTTTDLRDKFVVGAGSTYTVGATGGEVNHTLTTNEIPGHAHTLTAQSYGANVGFGTPTGWSEDAQSSGRYITKTTDGGNVGGAAHNNLPPYYSVCYLYKL